MPGAVRDTDHGYNDLVRRLYGMRKAKIKVGILSGDGAEQGRVDNPAETLLLVAICNEFGTTDPVTGEEHIPERSFIRAWFDEAEPKKREELTTLMREVVAGRRDKDDVLELLGLRCVGEIQERIATSIPPPNAASTVRRKGSSTTLINHGQLRAGITHKVVDE